MTNYEKYKDELYDILADALAITKAGKLMLCGRIECSECTFDFSKCDKDAKEWLKAEYVEKKVDWSLVPKDTQISIKVNGCIAKRHFLNYDPDKKEVYYYPFGKTSWTFDGKSGECPCVSEDVANLQRDEDIKRYTK